MKMKMGERESICLEVLKELPLADYVLIGGYAASSFDFPRFSVDLDLVIMPEKLNQFTKILEKMGFRATEPFEIGKDVYGGRFQRFEKDDVHASVDLLINSVASRQTGSSYSFEQLMENSQLREVVGFSSNVKARARVANREMLIALKANSMRLADQRDIIALCNSEVEVPKVVQLLKRCPREIVLNNIETFLETLSRERHKDSIKGVFMLDDRVYERIIRRAKTVFQEVQESLF
jgi:hypothetical protein